MDKVQALQKELEELKREKNQLLQQVGIVCVHVCVCVCVCRVYAASVTILLLQKENNRSQKAHYSWQHVADAGALMNAHQGPGPLEVSF